MEEFEMAEDIEKLKIIINYTFNERSLLRQALTHRSKAVEAHLDYDNQRLEFLGDAVLEIILSEHLYRKFPRAQEGMLTQIRSAMVQQDTLAALARKMNLGAFILLGNGEIENDGANRDSTLADLFESVLGAVYLDGGLEAARQLVIGRMEELFPEPEKLLLGLNPKGALQEYTQSKWNTSPVYHTINVSGPDHQPQYEVQVQVHNMSATGKAQNRRQAESQAAKNLLLIIAREDPQLLKFEMRNFN